MELHSRAYTVLQRQAGRTYLAGQHVFLNPFTAKPYVDERSQRRFFNFAVKKLKMRQRPAKNTRHTYATLLLMSGANPAWTAKQLGHSLQVFLTTYSTWIEQQDAGRELAKVEAFTVPGSIASSQYPQRGPMPSK